MKNPMSLIKIVFMMRICTVKEVTCKRRKIDLMGPMSAASDRANLSCIDMALIVAAVAKGMGLKVSETN